MLINQLNEKEREIIQKVFLASVNGPFFEDWEFSTLIGMERNQLTNLLESWPNYNDKDDDVLFNAIHNCIGNLLYYPHKKEQLFNQMVSAGEKELNNLLEKINLLKEKDKNERE